MTYYQSVIPIEILLVEDNPGDINIVQEFFEKCRFANNLSVVKDGVDAMDFLMRKGSFSAVPTPDLIILDLNLPKKSGLEVLSDLKSNEKLKYIPLLVLTSTRSKQDILACYNLHANAFVSKPMELRDFLAALESIENFWLSIAKLPPKSAQV